MHTARVLLAHEELQTRSSTIEDIKAQKNWLERFVFAIEWSLETFSLFEFQ